MLSKNTLSLQELSKLPFFTPENAAEVFGIKANSGRVLCSRYVKSGLLVKLKNNLYVTSQKWESISRDELFAAANLLQVPSYISLMSALTYYEVTTQVQQSFVESASVKRTAEYNVNGVAFRFYKVKKEFYFGFVRENNLFIATKEKALLDAVYLFSFGKYRFDISAIDLNKLDRKRLLNLARIYPAKTRKIVRKICRT